MRQAPRTVVSNQKAGVFIQKENDQLLVAPCLCMQSYTFSLAPFLGSQDSEPGTVPLSVDD